MIEFFKSNWKILFSGVGTAILVAILGYALQQRRRNRGPSSLEQSVKSGSGSQVVQAGRDAKAGNFKKK